MSKRKIEKNEVEFGETQKHFKFDEHSSKHTLDSDEEDSDDDRDNIMNENEFDGEEEGVSGMEGDIKVTPFNMKEELEEGHFDRDGHYHWDKSKEIKDNWLDNIDWVKVKTDKAYMGRTNKGLAESSDSDDENGSVFNEIEMYKEIIKLMEPKETISKALQRLGKRTPKLSSAERWRRKKAGLIDENAKLITKLTALTNEILTRTGNMDIYEETYEMIQNKISKTTSKDNCAELDMYSEDFESKEKQKLNIDENTAEPEECKQSKNEKNLSNNLFWEFKWKQEDSEIHGPYSTEQMQKWVEEKYFKNGVFVRKVGEDSRFYSSIRIDFELYL